MLARERIAVPAGAFDTCRVESSSTGIGDRAGGFYLQSSNVVWVDAQGLFVVKSEWKFIARKGAVVTNLGIELAELERVPR